MIAAGRLPIGASPGVAAASIALGRIAYRRRARVQSRRHPTVAAITFGGDTGFLTRVPAAGTAALEQGLIDRLGPVWQAAPGKIVNHTFEIYSSIRRYRLTHSLSAKGANR